MRRSLQRSASVRWCWKHEATRQRSQPTINQPGEIRAFLFLADEGLIQSATISALLVCEGQCLYCSQN